MAPLPLKLKFKPQNLILTSLRPFSFSSSSSSSSSSTPSFSDPNPNPNPEIDNSPQSPKSPSSSLFSDIKERLRSPTAPPRRIPDNPPLPPPLSSQSPSPAASINEIRKHLAEFRVRSSNPNAYPNPSPSHGRPISFQELVKDNAPQSTNRQNPNFRTQGGRRPYDSIRESLRQFRPSPGDPPRIGLKPAPSGPSLIGDHENLPDSIFGREMREKMGEKEGAGEEKALKTDFVKMYSYEELGEKLKRLRPEAAEKGDKDWFSLDELNLRLAKLRELEDKELESRMVSFSSLRRSLMRLADVESTKMSNSNLLESLL